MKCKACCRGIPRLAPKLKNSGYAAPKDLICPICSTFHCSESGDPTEEHKKKVKADRLKQMSTVSRRTSPYDLDIGD